MFCDFSSKRELLRKNKRHHRNPGIKSRYKNALVFSKLRTGSLHDDFKKIHERANLSAFVPSSIPDKDTWLSQKINSSPSPYSNPRKLAVQIPGKYLLADFASGLTARRASHRARASFPRKNSCGSSNPTCDAQKSNILTCTRWKYSYKLVRLFPVILLIHNGIFLENMQV